jgi:hypothetical protein
MRSLFDPLPRPLSTKTLAVLVGLVVLGTGVAVARFLESPPTPVLDRSGTVWAAPVNGREAPRGERAAPSGVRDSVGSRTAQHASGCDARPAPACSSQRSTSAQPGETPTLFAPPPQGS